MAINITRNKQAGRTAAWWIYEGATFTVYVMDTSWTEGTSTDPPAAKAPYESWISPVDFTVAPELTLTVTGGAVDYGYMATHIAEIPQLVFTLNYSPMDGDYTYTDLVITSTVAKSSALVSGDPAWAETFTVATIHEDPPITMDASLDSKVYYLDISAISAEGTES